MHNISDIFNTQRLFATIGKDIQRLKTIQAFWQALADSGFQHTEKKPHSFIQKCLPVSIKSHTLSIACESSLVANHLRFLQQQLLQELRLNNIEGITTLNIFIATDMLKHQEALAEENYQKKVERTIDPECITTLEQFKQSCKSETLRNSIQRLLNQLKKASKH
ncbi:MAG: DciA family protein [Arenicella sp.]